MTSEHDNRFTYESNDMIVPDTDYSEAIVYGSWTAGRRKVTNVMTNSHTVVLNYDIPNYSSQRFYMENSRNFLDTEGEWYYDWNEGILYVFTGDVEELSISEVIAPIVKGSLVILDNVEGNIFKDIQFKHVDWSGTDDQFTLSGMSQSSSFLQDAAFYVSNSIGNEFRNLNISHIGGNGFWFKSASKLNIVDSVNVTDIGGGGVRIGVGQPLATVSDGTELNVIKQSTFYNGGIVFEESCGVLIQRSSYNLISHNEISYFRYTGVSLGWEWGYTPAYTTNNIVEWNHIHHIGLSVLSDLGGIYTLGNQTGTILRNNKIHDCMAFTEVAHGIYLDQATVDVLVENNVVYHNKATGFFQHWGQDNVIRNNIFAISTDNFGLMWHLRDDGLVSYLEFTRNVVVSNGKMFASPHMGYWNASCNLYWSPSGAITNTFPNPTKVLANQDDHRVSTDIQTWIRVLDCGSIVEDPLLDADYMMAADSPAVKQFGFQLLNDVVEKAGRSQCC